MSLIPEREFVFTWKIENFSFCPMPQNSHFDSPIFAVDAWRRKRIQLNLYPRGLVGSDEIVCYDKLCDELREWENVSFESSFLIKGSEACPIRSGRQRTTVNRDVPYGMPFQVSRDVIFNRKEVFLPNDTLTIEYRIWITDKVRGPTVLVFNLVNEDILAEEILLNAARYELEGFKKHLCWNQCSAVTHISIGKKSFVWRVEGIRNLKPDDKLSIPVFSALAYDPKLVLSFYFTEGDGNNINANFQILRRNDSLTQHALVKFKLTALNQENDFIFLVEDAHLFPRLQCDETWDIPFSFHESVLRKCLDSANDVLYLRCEFTYSQEPGIYHTGKEDVMPLYCGSPANINSINVPLKELHETGIVSDVTLRVGKRSFKAHRNILSIRSPVFRAMFENNMKEKTSEFVDIVDVDPDAFDQMLTFLYLNEFNVPGSEEAMKLYKAADMYEVLPLKSRCSLFLQSVLSVSNVCSVLNLADLHRDDDLRKAVETFVYANKNDLLASENWKLLMENNISFCAQLMFQMLTGKDSI